MVSQIWFLSVADLAEFCLDPDDKMLPRLEALGERAELLRRVEGDNEQDFGSSGAAGP